MSGLLPTELHTYSIRDVIRGLAISLKPVESQTTIPLSGLGDGIPIRSARAALIIALEALGMPSGSKIGVPLYCCPVVFKAIRAAGCVPRFLDIDPETFCLSPEDLRTKRSGIDALIAVHMFGNLCDMPTVLEIMGGNPVIEDCAQSIGSKLNNRACGSFGDISFFSFRSGKYLSVGEGGALYSDKTILRSRISELITVLPVPTRFEEIKHVIMTFIRSKLRSQPLWGLVGSRIWAVYNKKTNFADKSPLILGRIFASDLATVRRRIPQLDSMISLQRAHAGYFEHNLHLAPEMLCRERPQAHYNRFMYPIILPTIAQRDQVATCLRSHGIGTSKPYEEVITGAARLYGYEGDCPLAESTLRRALVIPSFYALKSKDINRMTSHINQCYAEEMNRGKRALSPPGS
jgi:perosamine synthetase